MLSTSDRNIYTYSTEHKFYLWTPPRTGSNHATFIFNHFNFASMVLNGDGNVVLDHNSQKLVHNHQYYILPEHSDYKIICTARNPYRKLYSHYSVIKKKNAVKNIESMSFKDFILNNDQTDEERQHQINTLRSFLFEELSQPRKPDYFLRLEYLYEDYLKIPFINGSKLHTSGLLEDLCSNKINVNLPDLNISDFVDQELQNIISTEYSDYFDLLGYQKIL